MIKIFSLFFLITSGLLGCDGTPEQTDQKTITPIGRTNIDTIHIAEAHEFLYELNDPDETFKLKSDLEEISGLAISDSGEFLYAVQDEKGNIYKIDKATGEIVEKIKFHKDGDYEGIETVGDQIFVVKSTGTIYQVSNPGKKNQQVKKFNFFLSRENDVEGLAYDKKNNRLLLACKGVPATGEAFEVIRYKKVIYAYDLATSTMAPEPVYTIQLDNIRHYLDEHTSLREYEKLIEFFSAGKENLTFNPSALAIHPLTGELYVISSSGKVLLVLNESGKVLHVEKLEKDVHAQPEGMVFDKDGTLYISNEGKGGKPKLYRFTYKK